MNRAQVRELGKVVCLLTADGAALGLTTGARAQVAADVIAYTLQPVDASSVFAAFDDPVINDDGNVVFWAWESIDTTLNDECAGAIEIGLGTTTLGNHFATPTASPAWCSSNASDDVWLRFTAAASATHTLYGFLCVGTTNIEPAMTVYSGSCGALTPIAQICSQTSSNFSAAQGQTYYIRLGARPAPQPQHWTVTIDLRDATNPPVNPASPRAAQRGVWIVGADGVPHSIVREGMTTAFDPERTFRSTYFPALGPGDDIALLATTRDNAPGNQITRASVVRSQPDGTLGEVLRDNAALPDPLWLAPIPQIDAAGRLAYTLNNGSQLQYGDAVVSAGDHAPGTPKGVTFQLIDQPVSSAGLPIAFRARLQGGEGGGVTDANNLGLWVDSGAGLQLLARTGDPAPGAGDGVVWKEVALDPGVTDEGVFAFFATLDGPGVTADNNMGVWVGTPGSLHLAARTGDAAPGVPAGVFKTINRQVRINRSGAALIGGSVVGADIDATNNTGLWIVGRGAGSLVAREGQAATPQHADVLISNFFDPVFDDFGNVFVMARLRGEKVDRTNNEALLALRGASRRLLARSGDEVVLPNKDVKTIQRTIFGDSGPGAGRNVTSHQRQIVYRQLFTDGTEALSLATDTCVADWDGNGSVDSNDFFAFMVDFFNDNADVNADGMTTSQDFFDFLASFFTACE